MFNRGMLSLLVCSALMLVPGSVFGQTAAMGKDADKQALMKASEELIQAEVKGDQAAMKRIFASDYTHTHATGLIENQEQYLKRFNPVLYQSIEPSDEQFRFYGVTAVIVGHARVSTIHSGQVNKPFESSFLEVWVHQDGNWRCAAWVTTRFPETAMVSAPAKN